jgi:predicted ferric reductase
MSTVKSLSNKNQARQIIFWVISAILVFGVGFVGALGFFLVSQTSLGQSLLGGASWLLAANTTHTTWYITRSAGWIAYFLLWFSTVWGLILPTKFFSKVLSPTFTFDFHEYISLLAIGFTLLHIGILMFDQYLPYSLTQILFPFLSPYRPFWVGIGVLGFYLMLLVTVTFYLRQRIGQKKFKAIHTLSLVSFLGVVLHSFFSGTDSSLGIVQIVYLGTFLVVVFLTAYWLIIGRLNQREKEAAARSTELVRPTIK